MTTPTPPSSLTALSVLSLAFDIVSAPCSAAETQRAEVLLGIAREIREEQQYRSLRNMRAERKLAAAGIPSSESTTLRGYLDRFKQAGEQAERRLTQAERLFMQGKQEEGGPYHPATADDPGRVRRLRAAHLSGYHGTVEDANCPVCNVDQTQRLPIVWRLGDKADCRHCHTPIVYDARRMQDPVTKQEADPQYLWIHKYTDQRACAVATMSSDDAEPTHTFAEPSV